jgi:extracellular factor (EF) 3-hydroxypalmitic acid methyl ester biosynthesis protein
LRLSDEEKIMQDLSAKLDEFLGGIDSASQPEVTCALYGVTEYLGSLRDICTSEEWREVWQSARSHPIFLALMNDPFTRCSFERTDGYPGDARLLDFIYADGAIAQSLTQASVLGRAIFLRNRMVPACRAVRNRKDLLEEEIGTLLSKVGGARIMPVACGHARELRRIGELCGENLELFLALDQDRASLDAIPFDGNALERVNQGVVGVPKPPFEWNDLDLIYSLGLYDYLDARLAAKLTKRLFELLRPGGKLVIGNFCKRPCDRGYMEAVIDWFLRFRDEREVGEMASLIEPRRSHQKGSTRSLRARPTC